jgi:hypothetical protein
MDEQYQEARKLAEELESKAKDVIDDKKHHLAKELLSEARQLVGDLANQKSSGSLKSRIKSIIHTLEHIRSEGEEVMDFRHVEALKEGYEELEDSLHHFK